MFTIGADPELFLKDHSNKMISVIGKIGGTKEMPLPIGNGCAIQEDNVAAEFCIPPCDNAKTFIESITFALSDISERARDLDLVLARMVASHSFSKDQLAHPGAKRFGCDPDYNVYTGRPNPRPKAEDKSLRSAGGHVHVGTDKKPEALIKTMDLMLGVPSVLMDKDEERRKLYGKAGCFRYKPYGVEYRTLSNFWIWDERSIEWVYHQVAESIKFCDEFKNESTQTDEDLIIHCINNNDKQIAKDLIQRWSIQTL